MLTADTLFIAALAFVIACSLYFAPRIRSDHVANRFSRRREKLFFSWFPGLGHE